MSEPLEMGSSDHPATSLGKFLRNPDVCRKFHAMLRAGDLEDLKAGKNKRRRSMETKESGAALVRALRDGVPPIDAALLYGHPLDLTLDRARRLRKLAGGGKVAPPCAFSGRCPDYENLVKKRIDVLVGRGQLPKTFELPEGFFGEFKCNPNPVKR